MSFPIYGLTVRRSGKARALTRPRGRSARDAQPGRKHQAAVCVPKTGVVVYKVALKKTGTVHLPSKRIENATAAAAVAQQIIGDSAYEKMLTLLIDADRRIVGAVVTGTISDPNQTSFTTRGVFVAAIVHNAQAIYIAHNHPNERGKAKPSAPDLTTTASLIDASYVLGVPVLDHVIVTPNPSAWVSIGCDSPEVRRIRTELAKWALERLELVPETAPRLPLKRARRRVLRPRRS